MKQPLKPALGISVALILATGNLFPTFASHRSTSTPSGRSVTRSRHAHKSQLSTRGPGHSETIIADGRVLLLGGSGAEVTDLDSKAVIELSIGPHHPRAWHTATLLPDGRVLILGGVSPTGAVVAEPEVFDPETQRFQLVPRSTLTPRAYHSATLSTEGLVVIAGGMSRRGVPLRTAELWNPETGAIESLQSKLTVARRGHTATLLASGKILLQGGTDRHGRLIQSVEIFDPETRAFSTVDASDSENLNATSAPDLAASLPETGARSVPVDTRVSLRFSNTLRVKSVNRDTVLLRGPDGPLAARVVPAERGMLAFVTPESPLRSGTTYIVELNGLLDASGHELQSTSITFTTAGEQLPIFEPIIDEDWVPTGDNLKGNWKSGRDKSPWESLPLLEAESGTTALSGRVLTLNGLPLADVTLKIADRSARTDKAGRFLLSVRSTGFSRNGSQAEAFRLKPVLQTALQTLIIDGRTANKPAKTYGVFKARIDLEANRTNKLPFTIWMPKIDLANEIIIDSPTKSEVVVTTPRIPGLEVRIPAGTVITDHEGKPVTRVGITPIPVDRPPFPLPLGVDVPIYFTVQPGGAYLKNTSYGDKKGARIVYPNYRNEAPGAKNNFWHYDPDEKGWHVYGKGQISDDGKQVVPDPGVSVYEFTGAMIGTTDQPLGPPCDCSAWGGDPVHLGTGLFYYSQTDLYLPDTIPIAITRVYRPNNANSYGFGVGTSFLYETSLFDKRPNGESFKEVFWILPGGSRFRYDRVSGANYDNVVFENSDSPTAFFKSRMKWNGKGWDITLKDGTVFVHGEVAPLQAIRDRNGNTLTITWSDNQSGLIKKITSPNGRWVEFTYANFRITQARDNIGRTVNYEYDGQGRLIRVTNPAGGVTEYTYDSSHRMLTVKDARGIVYLTNEYDSNGRVIKQTQADNTTFQFAYTTDSNGKITQTDLTDPRGNLRRVTFNASGYTVTDTQGCCGGLAHTFERQAGTNFISSVTDPLNRRTAYSYDPMGNATSVTRLAGTANAVTTSLSYEPVFNQVSSVTDPLNHTTTFGYDSRGNLTRVTDPLNHQSTIAYNGAGLTTSVTNALNHTTTFGYDGSDLTSITDPVGNTVKRFVDGGGRLLSVTNPLGHSTKFEYDLLNRLTKVIDALQGQTQFAYDPNGNLLSLTDARSSVTSYAYNNMDRVVTRTDPLLRQESYVYNPEGHLQQVTDRKNQVTSYTFDNLDRLTQVTHADTSTITYSYDSVNRITQIVDSISGTISYSYDDLDRVLSETTPQGTVSYTYDAASRRTILTVPGQAVVNYTYDNADRLTQITQGSSVVTIAYDNADRRASLTLPNGVVTEYGFDNASRLIGLTYKKGANLLGNLTYEYDSAGRRVKVGGTFARTLLPQGVASATYNAANQQTGFGSQTLTYDNNGNLTSDGVNTYTWNARDELASMGGPGLSASFQYDATGRRVSKTVNGTTTSFLYDGDNIVQEKLAGVISANLLNATLDEPLVRTESATTSWIIADALGSTIALTDSAGTAQTQYSYEAFGKTSASGAGNGNASQYTGRENDQTGTYYYRARYYSPMLQRFISEDPIRLAGGVNLFAYALNNPLTFTDPFGLKEKDAWDKFFETWADIADIQSALDFWSGAAASQIQQGDWIGATCADLMSGLLGYSGLPTIQKDAEVLGSDAPVGDKLMAGAEMAAVGAGWFFGGTGKEIVIGGPKVCRIAPAGNRAWRKGWEPIRVNQRPHYHRGIPNPRKPGHSMPGGKPDRHRPWDRSGADKSWRDRF